MKVFTIQCTFIELWINKKIRKSNSPFIRKKTLKKNRTYSQIHVNVYSILYTWIVLCTNTKRKLTRRTTSISSVPTRKTGDIVKSICTSSTVYCVPKFWYCILNSSVWKYVLFSTIPAHLSALYLTTARSVHDLRTSSLFVDFYNFIFTIFLDKLKNRLWSKVRLKHLYLSLETTHTSFKPKPKFQLDRSNLDQNFVLRNEASFCGTNPHPRVVRKTNYAIFLLVMTAKLLETI